MQRESIKTRKLDPRGKIRIQIDKKQKVEFRQSQVMVSAGKHLTQKSLPPNVSGGSTTTPEHRNKSAKTWDVCPI